MKTGFVAVLGRANVGKSSLINSLVGQKVSIVSPKPQTTRDKIIGIYSDSDCQIIFQDTPGIHEPKNKLGEYMQNSVRSAVEDTDLILIMANAADGLIRQDFELIEKYTKLNIPVFLLYNKIDKIEGNNILVELDKLNARNDIKEVIPISCKTGHNLDIVLEKIKEVIPEGEKYYPDDEYTDKSERYIIAEIIREKILLFLQQEIPHGVQVVVEAMKTYNDKIEIDALIVVEKENHKPIVLGKEGSTIKRIGTAARIEIEKFYSKKIVLKTFVKVIENWRNKPAALNDLGFEKK